MHETCSLDTKQLMCTVLMPILMIVAESPTTSTPNVDNTLMLQQEGDQANNKPLDDVAHHSSSPSYHYNHHILYTGAIDPVVHTHTHDKIKLKILNLQCFGLVVDRLPLYLIKQHALMAECC
jgi:hypothetical protein